MSIQIKMRLNTQTPSTGKCWQQTAQNHRSKLQKTGWIGSHFPNHKKHRLSAWMALPMLPGVGVILRTKNYRKPTAGTRKHFQQYFYQRDMGILYWIWMATISLHYQSGGGAHARYLGRLDQRRKPTSLFRPFTGTCDTIKYYHRKCSESRQTVYYEGV